MRLIEFVKKYWMFLLLLILGSVYVVVGFNFLPNPKTEEFSLQKPAFVGTVVIDGGKWIDYWDPEQLKDVKSSSMIVAGHFTESTSLGDEMYMKLEELCMEMYVNNHHVFTNEYSDAEVWLPVYLGQLTPEDNVKFVFTSYREDISNSMYHAMSSICVGDQYSLLRSKLIEYAPSIFVSAIIFIFGFSVFFVAIILVILQIKNAKEYFVCGLLAMSGACCCLINYDFIQLLIPKIYGVQCWDYYSQSILSTSLLIYLSCYMGHAISRKIAKVFSTAWVLLVIANLTYAYLEGSHVPYVYGKMMVILSAFVIIELFMIAHEYFRTSNRDIQGVFFGTTVLAICIIIELIHYILTDWWLFAAIQMGLAFFVTIQVLILVNVSKRGLVQAMRVKEMEKEVMQAGIYSMVSQIQPHFLYNTLGTIRALVQINPDQACDVIDHFSKYLRANMSSLTNQDMIPFEQELEHARNYLFIEQVRFGDKIQIKYDIESTDFECPALLLQTTVENAIKHGLGNKRGGGYVWIRSHEEKNAYVIEVEDNGVGFDVNQSPDDGRVHVGIENSKKRLKGMCDGSYDIVSEIGKGTTVTIAIPKKSSNYKEFEVSI